MRVQKLGIGGPRRCLSRRASKRDWWQRCGLASPNSGPCTRGLKGQKRHLNSGRLARFSRSPEALDGSRRVCLSIRVQLTDSAAILGTPCPSFKKPETLPSTQGEQLLAAVSPGSILGTIG